MRDGEQQEETHQQSTVDPQTREFLALLAALPWLLKQYLADSLNLLETEGRLALRSLLMILALTLCLAGLIAGGWLVLVLLAVYAALEAGAPVWGVALGVILLHILVLAGLAQQIMSLAGYLLFPNSRRAFGALARREPPAHSPTAPTPTSPR